MNGPPGPRTLVALLAAAAALAGCDEFSTQHVADTCVRSALKAGEPYGNDRERQQTEAQLRQYCRAAAEGR